MKKLICIALCVVMVIGLCGCVPHFNTSGDERANNDGRITTIYNDGWCIVYRDNETGVQYMARLKAGLTIMLNPDGTPYTG